MINLANISFDTEFGAPNDIATFNTGLALNAANKPTLPLIWYRDANNKPDIIIKDGKSPSKHTKWFVQWSEYQNRAMEPLEFRSYWARGCNTIALVTGRYSRIYHVDLDFRARENIEPYLRSISPYVDNDQVRVEQSVSNGYKVYFQLAEGERWEEDELHNEKLAYAKDNPKVMIESRGEGGCSFVAPTLGYRAVPGFAPSLDKIKPITRETLDKCIDAARAFDEDPDRIKSEKSNKKTKKISPFKWTASQQASGNDTTIGIFNQKSGYTYTFLEDHGYTFDHDASDGNEHFTRPNKSGGTSLTIKEINGVPVLHNFSSSDELLEPDQSYSPFQLYMLATGLSQKEAIKALNKAGYAPPTKADMALEDLEKICVIERDDKGHVDETSRLTLANILTYHPLFDGLAANILCNGRLWAFKPIEGVEGRIDDKGFSMLRLVLQSKLGLNPSTSDLIDALNIVMLRKRRNPFIERLDEIVWDGIPRLRTFLAEAFDLPQNALTEELLVKFFAAVIARQLSDEPIVVEWMPVFSGNQETGKTSFLRNCCKMLHPKLSEEWYIGTMDMATFCDPKLRAERSEGAVICSIDDLKNVKKSDDESFKAAMSTPRALIRAAYGHFSTEVVQRFMLAATGNPQQFLKDPTGARRYVVLRIPLADDCCKLYDTGLMNPTTVSMLWAEAYQWYKDNYHDAQDLRLSKEAKVIAREYAEDAYNASPWEDDVQEYISLLRRGPSNGYRIQVDQEGQTVTLDEELKSNFFNPTDIYKFINSGDDKAVAHMERRHKEDIVGILTRMRNVEYTRYQNKRGYRVIPEHAVYSFSEYKTQEEKAGLEMLLKQWSGKEPDKNSIYISKGFCSGFGFRYYPIQPGTATED